jgi:hypothetical protein
MKYFVRPSAALRRDWCFRESTTALAQDEASAP